MYWDSQRNPSPYPCLFSTLHMKTSIGLKFSSLSDTLPWKPQKKATSISMDIRITLFFWAEIRVDLVLKDLRNTLFCFSRNWKHAAFLSAFTEIHSLKRSCVNYLSSGLSVKAKHSSEPILTDGLRAVDLIPQDEDRDVWDGFIRHQGLQTEGVSNVH